MDLDLSSPASPSFPVGTKVKYKGKSHYLDGDMKTDILKCGMVFEVVKVTRGHRGTGHMIFAGVGEEPPAYDETSHGYSVVELKGPTTSRGYCIDVDNLADWEVIGEASV